MWQVFQTEIQLHTTFIDTLMHTNEYYVVRQNMLFNIVLQCCYVKILTINNNNNNNLSSPAKLKKCLKKYSLKIQIDRSLSS